MNYLSQLKTRIDSIDGIICLDSQKGQFSVKPVKIQTHLIGVEVSNLGQESFLSWDAFVCAVSLLIISKENSAIKGNAMNYRLGEEGLPFDLIEGHISQVVYNKVPGDSVFRRITPISHILEWAGICENGRGYLRLKS